MSRGPKASPALVVACVALLVSLTGTSVAAVSQLGRGTVGTPQLKNGAVTSKKVKNGTLQRADFKAGQVPAGPRGETGPAGPAGGPGPVGPSTVYHARFAYADPGTTVPHDYATLHTIALPAGSYAAIATTTVTNNRMSSDTAHCEIVSGGASAEYVASAAAMGQQAELSGTVGFTLAGTGAVSLRCRQGGTPGNMERNASTLTVIKVGEGIQQ
jgi:hypothetical protein